MPAAVGLLLGGCSGGGDTSADPDPTDSLSTSATDPTATATRTQAPPPAPPKVGACRTLGVAQVSLFSDESKGSSCQRQHTAYTYAVLTLPSDIALTGVRIQNDAVQNAAAGLCQTEFRRFIGGTASIRALSRLTATYFLPTQRGFDLGARWVRCDVVAFQNTNVLSALPDGGLEGFLNSPRALDDYGVCSRGEPGVAKSVLVTCDQEHDFRAVDALRLGLDQAPYPGKDDALSEGSTQCRKQIAKLLGLDGGFVYAYTYPSSSDWADGQRFGYCWNKSND